jgi:hypothetical protein
MLVEEYNITLFDTISMVYVLKQVQKTREGDGDFDSRYIAVLLCGPSPRIILYSKF